MALVDSNYQFIYVDIGCNGRVSDGGVFKNCTLGKALENDQMMIPKPSLLPKTDITAGYVIVADDAFPLKETILKPYNRSALSDRQRIFNYRLSRARRVVENAFGILCNRFQVYMKPITLEPSKVEDIVLCTCCLHNFLRANSTSAADNINYFDSEDSITHELLPGSWRQEPASQGVQAIAIQGTNYTNTAKDVRETFCNYFNRDAGSVPWQNKLAFINK